MRPENPRLKLLTLLALAAGSGMALLAATQDWFALRLAGRVETAINAGEIAVPGAVAAPALTALSLAGLALTAAFAIAGPVFRVVLALLGFLLGASILFTALSALGDPLRASSMAITAATGVAGDDSTRRLAEQLTTAFWPWLAVLGGGLILFSCAVAIVTLRRWPGSASRKYQSRFLSTDGRSAEDALAEVPGEADEEPEAETDEDEARAVAEGGLPPPGPDRDGAIDSWDELSRGDDPTR